MKALIGTIHKLGAGTLIALELSLYSSIHRSLAKSIPQPSLGTTLHVARSTSNSSFIVPIADFPSVGHPHRLVPKRMVTRYVAEAGWHAAQQHSVELARYNTAIKQLEKIKTAREEARAVDESVDFDTSTESQAQEAQKLVV